MKIEMHNMKAGEPKKIQLLRSRAGRKVYISVGYKCNNDCWFFVTADKRVFRDRTTKEIKDALRESYLDGVRDVVFTGGECSIREDIVDLLAFAKELGFRSIGVQTNGRAFSS